MTNFAYTIWHQTAHLSEPSSVISELADICDIFILTVLPRLERDNSPVFIDDGGLSSDSFRNALELCMASGKKVYLQSIPTPANSRGKTPEWWQGWVFMENSLDWQRFFNEISIKFQQLVQVGEENGVDGYLLGAELTSTLGRFSDWQNLFAFIKRQTRKSVGYSHHFSLPLKYYYRWELFFAVIFGWLFKRDKVYADLLKRLLAGDFYVPDDQLVEVGKRLYQTANFNFADLDFVKLNDYFWYVMDTFYDDLATRWESVIVDGMKIEFLPAVRAWINQYCVGKKLWIENDLNMGYVNCTDEYYQNWWEVFLSKHKSLADVIVVWENGFGRWSRAIREIL